MKSESFFHMWSRNCLPFRVHLIPPQVLSGIRVKFLLNFNCLIYPLEINRYMYYVCTGTCNLYWNRGCEKWTCCPDSKPINICSYSLLLLHLATVLSVLLRFTDYDWPFVSSNSSLLLLIEATNTNFIVFELTRPEFELEARTLTFTPQI